MLRLKFFVFLVFTMVFAWVGFSHVFSQWADRAQADAEALALQTARAVSAQLPVSPYMSLAHSPVLKQALVVPPNSNITKVGQELSKRLTEVFPDWGTQDIALLSEKTSEKTLWLMGHHPSDKAPEGYIKQVVQDAAHRREVVEMGNGLKVFFLVEPPAEVESSLNLWIGGPAMRSWESNLAQELKRTSALALGVVISGKLVMSIGQPHQPRYLSLLNAAISNVRFGSVGALKNAEKREGALISTFWGTSKQLATGEMAVRQNLSTDKVELVVVFSNTATQEARLRAEQMVFYGWWVVLLAGLLVGVVLPAGPKVVPNKEEAVERTEPLPALPKLPSSPPSPSLPSSAPSLSSPSSLFSAFLAEAEPKTVEKVSAPKAEEALLSEMSLPAAPFVSSKLSELLQTEKPKAPAPSSDLIPMPEVQEESAVGLRGKAVQPEELLGVDYAPHENPAAVFEATLREEAERFLGADFLPEHSSLTGEVLATSALEGAEVAQWRNVFAEFLRVRKQCGQDTEGLNFERFKTKLEASKRNLLAKHACKTVRFLVQIKDGKAAIKAIPVRE